MRQLPLPAVGEIWMAYLDPTTGREQRGTRPVIVVSADWFNNLSNKELLLIVPMTTSERYFPSHVPIRKSKHRDIQESWAMCEQIRVVSNQRFKRKIAEVTPGELKRIRAIVNHILTD